MQKKGMSAVIVTLLLVMISIVLVGVVWGVINGVVKQKISTSSSCFGNFDQLTLNSKYTCYNTTSGNLQFSVNVGDVALDGVVVTVSNAADSVTFTLSNKTNETGLTDYNGNANPSMPQKNSGKTYLYAWAGSAPNAIEIAPTINGNTCSSTSSISPITDCYMLS